MNVTKVTLGVIIKARPNYLITMLAYVIAPTSKPYILPAHPVVHVFASLRTRTEDLLQGAIFLDPHPVLKVSKIGTQLVFRMII